MSDREWWWSGSNPDICSNVRTPIRHSCRRRCNLPEFVHHQQIGSSLVVQNSMEFDHQAQSLRQNCALTSIDMYFDLSVPLFLLFDKLKILASNLIIDISANKLSSQNDSRLLKRLRKKRQRYAAAERSICTATKDNPITLGVP